MLTRAPGRPPFRADHVGSLLRPPAIRQAFKDRLAGRLDDDAFARVQDDCIRDVVKLQEAAGLKVVTDGEFRRSSYWGRFVERLEGFEIRPAAFKFRDDEGHEVEFAVPYAAGKIRRTQPLALDEFGFLQSVARQSGNSLTPKITLPAPSATHFYRCTDYAAPAAYRDIDTFFADLVTVYRAEIAALAEAGCRYVQLDEVALAMLCDPAIRAKVSDAGGDPDHLVRLYVESINAAIAEAPAEMAIGVHMCRGNFKGHYLAEGSYASVAEKLFSQAKVTHFLLEYDTPRAGDFAPLRFVPAATGVVLGLVSSKTPVLEEIDMLKRRVDEASRHIDFDRLAIGPQCGFASTAAGNPLTEADERAKLALVVRAAEEIWG